jgi:hypothetical protein
MDKKKWLGLFASLMGILATVMGAVQMIGRVRLVDILFLFFGGFGCGAGLVKVIFDFKKPRTQN